MSDIFYVKVDNKRRVIIGTETRFFDITNCRILPDGLVPRAKHVSNETVAELLAGSKSARAKVVGRSLDRISGLRLGRKEGKVV